MIMVTFRRHYLDKILQRTDFFGDVLDVGGKKENKRGLFRPPINKVNSWKYLNIDPLTKPDYCCSAEKIPVSESVFDIVLMTEVLEHLQNPEVVLKEIHRVLRKEGKLIATMPFLYPIHSDPNDYQRWTPQKIRVEIERGGFSIDQIVPMGSLFAVYFDLLHISFGIASKKRKSIKNRLINKFIMPPLAHLFMLLDNAYEYKNKQITTGFYFVGKKSKHI